MASNGYGLEARPTLLRGLFEREMTERLTKIALDAIRPAAEQAAREVVKEMAPALQEHFNLENQQLMLSLFIDKVRQ